MLAEFASRLACGLAFLILLTPWRLVPPKYFRTHSLVILGLIVLCGLDQARQGVDAYRIAPVVAAGVLAYLSAVAWGMGLPRVGMPLTCLVVAACGLDLAERTTSVGMANRSLEVAARLSSSFLMGSTLTAMLLGHYYLTAPAMSIEPLKRFVRCMGVGLVIRSVLAGVGVAVWLSAPRSSATVSPLFLAVRWGIGVVGPAVATWMTWQTVKIRSTQSATGILYIAMALVLFGELTAMVLFVDTRVVF